MQHRDSKGRLNSVRVLTENGDVVVKVDEMYGTSQRTALRQDAVNARRLALEMLIAAQKLEDQDS